MESIWRNVSFVLMKRPTLSFSLVLIKYVPGVTNESIDVPSAITCLTRKFKSYQEIKSFIENLRVQESVHSLC